MTKYKKKTIIKMEVLNTSKYNDTEIIKSIGLMIAAVAVFLLLIEAIRIGLQAIASEKVDPFSWLLVIILALFAFAGIGTYLRFDRIFEVSQ